MKNVLLIIFVITLWGCSQATRSTGCDLDRLNLKGDIRKIETIVKSAIPLTEIFYATYNPEYIIMTSGGNCVLEFNDHGNVKRFMGYGLDGANLFNVKCHSEGMSNLYPGLLGTADQNMSGLRIGKISKDNLNRIVETEWYLHGKLSFVSQNHYDTNGDLTFINKKYISETALDNLFKIDLNDYDTTFYHYKSYDQRNNWTEVQVVYHGVLPRHNHTYCVKRQITYNDSPSQTPLIKQLSQYNQVETKPLSETRIDTIAGLGLLSIPHYMISDNETAQTIEEENKAKGIPQKHLCMYKYDGKDAYASISISDFPQEYASDYETWTEEEMEYNKDTDEYIQELLSQTGVGIFKWLPYCFSSIGNKRSLCVQYYRHGQGSPIPVYVKSHEFKGSNGHDIIITISYQSNQVNRFHDDFEAILNSIELY